MAKTHYDVGIVGLGYVGLTLATALADTGLRVLGVERRQEIVAKTNDGVPHFREVGLDYMLGSVTRKGLLDAATSFDPNVTCDTYILTVGTPLSENGEARLDFIEAASREIADNM